MNICSVITEIEKWTLHRGLAEWKEKNLYPDALRRWNVICTQKDISFWVDKLICLLSVKPVGTWQGFYFPLFSLFSWENVNITELTKVITEKCHFGYLKKRYPLFGIFKGKLCEILTFLNELFNIWVFLMRILVPKWIKKTKLVGGNGEWILKELRQGYNVWQKYIVGNSERTMN